MKSNHFELNQDAIVSALSCKEILNQMHANHNKPVDTKYLFQSK